MAVVTNAFTSSTGTREDLLDKIYRVDVEDTPVTSRMKRRSVKNRLFDWQVDSIRAVNLDNKHLTGDTTARLASVDATRYTNVCQISKENATIAGTIEAENRAGRASEMRYQKSKKIIALKKDVEAIILSNQAYSNNEGSGARTTRGFEAWIRTNASRAGDGADPADPNTTAGTTATDGTQRAFTEALLLATIQEIYAAGGKPKTVVMGLHAKKLASAFTGRATSRQNIDAKTITQGTDLYASDFGTVQFVPHRYLRSSGRTVLIPDMEYMKLAFLRPYTTTKLGRIGDAETEEVIVEYALEMSNERAHGVVADLLTS